MPGLTQRNAQFVNSSSGVYPMDSANEFWSKQRGDISYHQIQKFWSELSPQARQELLRIDKPTLFEQARKNMYCSRCNGLLLEGFLQIVMYGKSLQQDGAGSSPLYNRPGSPKDNEDGSLSMVSICQDGIQNPSIHPWGGLTTTRDGSLTLLDCYLHSKSLEALQNVFDSARARERERELLYPDACGGGGRGWISQRMTSYGRGHGIRETCALHTAKLSCDTLVDFWSALGEETRHSLLRMKEEDFFERLMYRFDSKRFCRDCRRNVIREFKELKELKRIRREPRCTVWFCVADTAFQYEVSDDTVQADWSQTFEDPLGTYHKFEWAIGTGEGKYDILEFENVGMNSNVQVDGLDLCTLSALFITLRAWRPDGRCTELSVKAHALNGQQCVHCRLMVGDGLVTITRGESIRSFFEHAEEVEEEEEDESMDKDGNELEGECSRPQKHAKSPELAREFLLDASTVIFKEQVEKAFREGTARQNAHGIFVCLAHNLLEERVHVACKEIITLEKQMKLLEEEEREKREEEDRKERRRTKEREKKLRRKERLKGKDKDREKNCSETIPSPVLLDAMERVSEEPKDIISFSYSVCETNDIALPMPVSPDLQDEEFTNGDFTPIIQKYSNSSRDEEMVNERDSNDSFTVELSKFSRRRYKFQKEVTGSSLKWSDRRLSGVTERGDVANKSEHRCHDGESIESPSRGVNGLNRQLRVTALKSNARNCSFKFHSPKNRSTDGYDSYSYRSNQNNEYRAKVDPYISSSRSGRDPKGLNKSESSLNSYKKFSRGNKNSQIDYMRGDLGRLKSNSPHTRKVWEPMESHKYPRSNSDSDITMRLSNIEVKDIQPDTSRNSSSYDTVRNSGRNDIEDSIFKESGGSICKTEGIYENGLHGVRETCCSREAVNKVGNVPNISSSATSDNCSSCLSEGDNNTGSSNQGNLESSSTSDSEDASQQSEGRGTSICLKNGSAESCELGMESKQTRNEGECYGGRKILGFPQGTTEVNSYLNSLKTIAPNSDIPASIGMDQSMLPPVHGSSLHFPVFQAPVTMGYYHQNPISWPAAPNNGFMSFSHPNPYLYASPLGYGINGNSNFCLQYSALPNVAAPMYKHVPLPVYQHVAKATAVYSEEHHPVPKMGAAQGVSNGANTERVLASAVSSPTKPPSNGKPRRNGNCVKPYADNKNFSLFHFGGPVALANEHRVNPDSLEAEIVGDLSVNISADRVEFDNDCNKKEPASEEYNLFANSNGTRFSFF